jgi:hypothetical protein
MQTVAAPILAAKSSDDERAALPRTPTLDSLLTLDHDALSALYRHARVPSIADVEGPLRGRMLAVPALPRIITALPRAWARTGSFPWRGKSFYGAEADHGHGINRVASDRLELFRFRTFVGPSLDDGADAVRLDYDHPGNPFFIRPIADEIREISERTYLGQAWLVLGDTKRFVLWFGLTHR